MASPIAVPMIADSASGVSMTRASPKSASSPSVIRKTPPSLPTSSPITTTFSSAAMAVRRPVLRALASVSVERTVRQPFVAGGLGPVRPAFRRSCLRRSCPRWPRSR